MAAIDDLQHALLDHRRAAIAPLGGEGTPAPPARRPAPARGPAPESWPGGEAAPGGPARKATAPGRPPCPARPAPLPRISSIPSVMYRSAFLIVCLRDPVIGHLVRDATVGHLDVVAEDLVEADAQRSDLRLSGQLCLVSGEPLLAAGTDVAQAVELRHRTRRRSLRLRADEAAGSGLIAPVR